MPRRHPGQPDRLAYTHIFSPPGVHQELRRHVLLQLPRLLPPRGAVGEDEVLVRARLHCQMKIRCPSPGVDQNFLRFSTILGEKIGVNLKNQCYDQTFA
jgi:hypothetical protein